MNAPERFFLPDTQSETDPRNLPIQRVGVKGLRYPMRVVNAAGDDIATIGTFSMTVGLPGDQKGTHMSRFVELLEALPPRLRLEDFAALEAAMRKRLGADSGRLDVAFPYFIRKSAPVSGVASLLDYDARVIVEGKHEHSQRTQLHLTIAATSLCPCSKNISEYGAHNQRSHLTVRVETAGLQLEALAALVEAQASCEVFGLLKRPDEKYVTERAYDNPKFVEDLVRDIALALAAHPQIGHYHVTAENFESIHNHSAFAELWSEPAPNEGI
ncbi:MAG: GTP cyclohydrolase I FolE2 [Hydrogenophilaceae bacterium]|nr:GTP cyclohydrolase I FolE2 [Hydrogenophilaceae bacterium]